MGLFLVSSLALAYAMLLLSSSIPQSDQTSIWSYHAKALSCESLFGSDYVREAFWTGTHPEYPLYQPFLHSYFFSLNDSFRDDVVKIWQAVAIFLLAPIFFLGLKAKIESPVFRTLVVTSVFFLFQNQARDAPPELGAAVFTVLLTLNLINRDWSRIPLYVLGLVTTKNEGGPTAVVFLLLTAIVLVWPDLNLRKEKTVWRSLGLSVLFILAWTGVAVKLPSRHEQYTQRIFHREFWQTGIAGLPIILKGYFQTLKLFPYVYVVAAMLLGLATRPRHWRREFVVLFLWPLTMLFVFLLIYIISPWGPLLYTITLNRLLLPIFPPWLILSAIVLWEFHPRYRKLLIGLWAVVFFNAAWMHHWAFRGSHLLHNELVRGYPKYLWELDAQLPSRARIALIDSGDFFYLNYLMYPRKIYTCAPDIVQGTWRGDFRWKDRKEVDVERFKIDAILKDEKLIWVRN